MEDGKDEQLCNQSHTIEKPAVCHEELNSKEGDEGSQMDVSFCFLNSEFFVENKFVCLIMLRNGVVFLLKCMKRMKL